MLAGGARNQRRNADTKRDKGGINYDLNAAGQRNEEREHFMLFNVENSFRNSDFCYMNGNLISRRSVTRVKCHHICLCILMTTISPRLICF